MKAPGRRSLACLLALWACAASAESAAADPAARERFAVVVGVGAGLDPEPVRRARAQLSDRFELYDDAEVRPLLEGGARPERGPDEEVRGLLDEARSRLRRFEMKEVARALRQAQSAAERLPPTPSARVLAIEVAVREAEAALVSGDEAGQRSGMALALSIDPALKLDPLQYPPTLTRLLDATRARLQAAGRVEARLTSVPPGAQVFAAGKYQGTTPLVLPPLARAPQVLWLVADGHRPLAARVDLDLKQEVEVRLEAVAPATRVLPLVEALRGAAAKGRAPVAATLARLLNVDGIAFVESGSAPPTLYRVVDGATTPPPAVRERARWPAFSAAGLALGAGAAGLICGLIAQQESRDSMQQRWVTDGLAQSASAHRNAQIANVLFGTAGVLAALGVVFYVVF